MHTIILFYFVLIVGGVLAQNPEQIHLALGVDPTELVCERHEKCLILRNHICLI